MRKLNLLSFSIFVVVFSLMPFKTGCFQKFVIGGWPIGGMGVSLVGVLNYLAHCESANKIPVVYWPKDHSLYYCDAGFNGKRSNVWEYYFQPVSNLRYEPGDPIHPYRPGNLLFSYHKTSQATREHANELVNKYMKFNKIVQNKIDQFYNIYMARRRTIGIHLRGTDKGKEEKLVTPETMVKEALKHVDGKMQFFIASDEQKLLDRMNYLLSKAGYKVVYYDCYRSQDGQPIHMHKRPSYAQVGEDVLVEMALLAKCDILVHTLSNVSLIPIYFNSKLKKFTVVR